MRESHPRRSSFAGSRTTIKTSSGAASSRSTRLRCGSRAPRCLERSFITLDDAQLLVACLAQLERGDGESRANFAGAPRRLRLEHAARRVEASKRRLCVEVRRRPRGESGAGERRAGDDSRAMLHRATEISAGNSALRESDSHAQRGAYAESVNLATSPSSPSP